MFKHRLPSAILIGGVFFSSLLIPGYPGKIIFLIFGVMLSFFSVYEYLNITDKIGMKSFPVITSVAASIIFLFTILRFHPVIYLYILVFGIVFGWLIIIFSKNSGDVFKKAVNSLSALFFVFLPLNFLTIMYIGCDDNFDGRKLAFFLVAVTKSGDIGAYIAGVLSAKMLPGGNHKIFPSISPQKSWEGTVGGLFSSIIISITLCYFIPAILPDFVRASDLLIPVCVGIFLFVGGFAGDIAESSLKRAAGVKDSGNIIPGIGGVLDLLDSLILNAPIFYLFVYA